MKLMNRVQWHLHTIQKARSTQNKGVPLFSYLGYGAFGKGKGFS